MMEDNLSSSHRGFELFSFLARADIKKSFFLRLTVIHFSEMEASSLFKLNHLLAMTLLKKKHCRTTISSQRESSFLQATKNVRM